MNKPLSLTDIIEHLPTPKGVALALGKACRREDVHLQDIANLVRTDPALSGRLLVIANAAASGGRSFITIDDAISRMGIVVVSQVALAFSLIDQHSSGACENFNYAGFWSQSLLMAAASKELGTQRNLGTPGELFTAGLFAQVGRLALATAYPQQYSDLLAIDSSHLEMLQQEKATLGATHLELAEALMEHWGIPPAYASPFAHHEELNLAQFADDPRKKGRAQLAHSAWVVAYALSCEELDAVLQNKECLLPLAWLEVSDEILAGHLAEIESVWRLWLTLISRQR